MRNQGASFIVQSARGPGWSRDGGEQFLWDRNHKVWWCDGCTS